MANKLVYPIQVMSGTADLIVVGEIISVDKTTYAFKISETIKGKNHNIITIKIWGSWKCDNRQKFEKGQRLFLFLQKKGLHYRVINESTGERPIENDSITLLEPKSLTNPELYKVSLADLKGGIADFCKCFSFIGSYNPFRPYQPFRQLCSNDQISQFKIKSKFSEWLFGSFKEDIEIGAYLIKSSHD